MPLVDVEIRTELKQLPDDVDAFLREADQRIERFQFDNCVPGFVPCDFVLVYAALGSLIKQQLPSGWAFCEWGSGFGVVASLASMLGFEACGIEIESRLVEEADELAVDHGLATIFYHASFIPEGGERFADQADEFAWLHTSGSAAHDDEQNEPSDFDVIFAFPWPGEEGTINDLFEHYAAVGALLVTYHGKDGVYVRRKVA